MKLIYIIIAFIIFSLNLLIFEQSSPASSNNSYDPIVNFPGLYQGSQFIVDGPLWYDGDAVLRQYNHNQMKISINMRVPNITIPYKVINNRISIAIGLNRLSNSKYNLTINDYNSGKNYIIPSVRLLFGETEGGWFSGPKEYIKIVAVNQQYTFVVQEPGRLSLTSNLMPGSLSLIQKG
jgi:hypothetical protein